MTNHYTSREENFDKHMMVQVALISCKNNHLEFNFLFFQYKFMLCDASKIYKYCRSAFSNTALADFNIYFKSYNLWKHQSILCYIFTTLPMQADSPPIRVGTLDLLYRQLRKIQLWASVCKQQPLLNLHLSTKTGKSYGNRVKFL